MYKLQSQEVYSEDERIRNMIKEVESSLFSSIEDLLKSQRNNIGSGNTAEVHHHDTNPGICMKIISEQVLLDRFDGVLPPFNSLSVEIDFMNRAAEHSGIVKTPQAYGHDIFEDEEGNKVHVLFMERLNAVSIRDIHNNLASLPKNFDMGLFFAELQKFLENLNEAHVYHGDIAEGNIMIDLETGHPRLIDFGKSKLVFSSEKPEHSDISDLKRVRRLLENKVNSLTNSGK